MSELEELHRARVVLELYGGHSSFCATDREPEMACDCGFTEEVGGEDPAEGEREAKALRDDRELAWRLNRDGWIPTGPHAHGGEDEPAGERHLGPLRWRGHLNWKDIVERGISGFGGALVFYVLVRLFG